MLNTASTPVAAPAPAPVIAPIAAPAPSPASSEIAALLAGSRWSPADSAGGASQPTVITYSFANSGSAFGSDSAAFCCTMREFCDTDKQVTRDVLANIEAVCNVRFVEVADTPDAHGVLRYASSQRPNDMGYAGYAFYPLTSDIGGDIWIGQAQTGIEWSHYRPGLILHETLHAIGLKHPFEDGPVLDTPDNIIPNTVMSYSPVVGATAGALSRYPTQPMPLDIKALQALYGAATHNAGDTVYDLARGGFQDNFQAIWDSGGNDTLDASGVNGSVALDLHAGMRSDIGLCVDAFAYGSSPAGRVITHFTYTDTLAIAEGTVIENAVGSAFDDVIRGNSANNRLDGGAGLDTVVYAGQRVSFSISVSGGNFVVADRSAHEGTDTLRNVERLKFADGNVALDLDGNAGTAARILAAVAGLPALGNPDNVGRVLGLLDAGQSTTQVASFVIDAALGVPHTNASFVQQLYSNATGHAASEGELAYYSGLLESGAASQASLALLAADCSATAARIDLVGLASHGIAYTEFA